MGSDWSCPCGGERENVKNRISHTPEIEKPEKMFPQLSIEITTLIPSKIQRRLNRPPGEYFLSAVSKHPKLEKCLLFYSLETDLQYRHSADGRYEVIYSEYRSLTILQSEIEEKYKEGFEFLGGYWDQKNILLIFYNTGIKISKNIVVKIETGFDISELKKIFIEEALNLFIGCIQYRGSCIMFFEKPNTPRPFQYFVSDYAVINASEASFEEDLAIKIHKCIAKESVKFRGCISYNSAVYLIFIQNY